VGLAMEKVGNKVEKELNIERAERKKREQRAFIH
jgi:hypothetical protein